MGSLKPKQKLRVGLVMPHIFMHAQILPHVIFAPGQLAIALAHQLQHEGVEVTFFCPGPLDLHVKQINSDLSYFEAELAARGDSYMELLKKHPFTFITLARQLQSELVAKAYDMANNGELDVVHVYANEEDIALPYAQLCRKPVVFTHHDPFNFLVKYRSVFPKYARLPWISMSLAQRKSMPADTHWVGNIYHGLDTAQWQPVSEPGSYVAYLGRIIEPKGLHLAIKSIHEYNHLHPESPLVLKIAGKHYSGEAKDSYWQKYIQPAIDDKTIIYLDFISDLQEKQAFLSGAKALVVPSTFDEPFGMVMIEALACGTPLVGLDSGAITEVIKDGKNGILVKKEYSSTDPRMLDEDKVAAKLADAYEKILLVKRKDCRKDFEDRFTLERMAREHAILYQKLVKE